MLIKWEILVINALSSLNDHSDYKRLHIYLYFPTATTEIILISVNMGCLNNETVYYELQEKNWISSHEIQHLRYKDIIVLNMRES